MENIKLSNDTAFTLITNGVNAINDMLSITIDTEESLEAIETYFKNKENINKISMVDSAGETVALYNNYTTIKSISKELVTVIAEDGTETQKYITNITLAKDDIREKLEKLETVINNIISKLSGFIKF